MAKTRQKHVPVDILLEAGIEEKVINYGFFECHKYQPGWEVRVLLAQAPIFFFFFFFFCYPDILLLDEPTNNLDNLHHNWLGWRCWIT